MSKEAAPNFDKVIPVYDFFKTVLLFGSIQRCQYHHLPFLKESKNLLVIGGGTGKIIEKIHECCNLETMLYVDSSAKMVQEAKRFSKAKVTRIYDRIDFQTADVLSLSGNCEFDAIIAPFVLDCFTDEQLDLLGSILQTWLAPGGLFLFSDFHESRGSMTSRIFSRSITRPLYFTLNALCGLNISRLPDFDQCFHKLPLDVLQESSFFSGVLMSKVFRLNQNA